MISLDPAVTSDDHASRPSSARRLWASLSRGGLGVAIGFAFAAALMLSPIFVIPFMALLGRTVFVALVLLLVFVAVQKVPEAWFRPWFARWALSLIATVVAAPLATFAVYLFSVGGDLPAFTGSEQRLLGFVIIAGIALTLGMVIALSAQLRQREAQSRALALRFELERSRLERQAVDARLSLLQAQIQPHFLFNTLANVQALVESHSPRAPEVLKSLIAYLRASVPRLQQAQATFGDEATLVRAYLELMQMRMPDRLQFSMEVDDAARGQPFPSAALLTLVENAVHHGIDPAEEGGRIDVSARLDEAQGRLRVTVVDSGVGLDINAPAGTGLANLRARLAALHGTAASLELSENAPHGVRAELVLPAGRVRP